MTSVLCFADFELRASQRRLLKNGLPLQTAGRALSLLPAPVAQRHRLVGQAELLGLCWPGQAVTAMAIATVAWPMMMFMGLHNEVLRWMQALDGRRDQAPPPLLFSLGC